LARRNAKAKEAWFSQFDFMHQSEGSEVLPWSRADN